MILALDVGNSHIVLGCMEDGRLLCRSRMATDREKTEYEYAVMIRELLELQRMGEGAMEGAIISSVVPEVTGTLSRAVKLLTGLESMVVGAGLKTGLNIRIDDPAQLGSDLAVGAVAALSLARPPLIVIDLGTGTTLSALDKSGSFLGGIIIPGVRLSLNALTGRSSLLPDIALEAPKKYIGSNTVDCLLSGSVFGTAAMLDGLIERMEAELGESAQVIATGGLAESIIPHCRRDIRLEKDLLFIGLWEIWKRNRRSRT